MEDSPELPSRGDRYGGVIVAADALPADRAVFRARLAASLALWARRGVRGVWLRVPVGAAELVPEAVAQQFALHHAHPEYVMLTRWLGAGRSMIPSYATHYVGVGGVVHNARGELLVVSERYRQHAAAAPLWKLPGGLVEPGEDLRDAAVREVFEETGVRTEFVDVRCFRHKQVLHFGRGDVFFVCTLRALSDAITIDPEEIDACRWMPVDEYLRAEHSSALQTRIAALLFGGAGPPAIAAEDLEASHSVLYWCGQRE